MNPKNTKNLVGQVHNAAYQALKKKNFVTPIDIFLGIGWLTQKNLNDWRKGKAPYLERLVSSNLKKISLAMKIFRKWAAENNLKPSESKYMKKSRGFKEDLQFSKSEGKINTYQ